MSRTSRENSPLAPALENTRILRECRRTTYAGSSLRATLPLPSKKGVLAACILRVLVRRAARNQKKRKRNFEKRSLPTHSPLPPKVCGHQKETKHSGVARRRSRERARVARRSRLSVLLGFAAHGGSGGERVPDRPAAAAAHDDDGLVRRRRQGVSPLAARRHERHRPAPADTNDLGFEVGF